MEGNCELEYVLQTVANSQQWVVLRLYFWHETDIDCEMRWDRRVSLSYRWDMQSIELTEYGLERKDSIRNIKYF